MLLLVESVVDDAATNDFVKLIDVHMLVETGGRERTEPEWRVLLDGAGFRIDRIFSDSPWCVLEAVPA